MTLLSAHGSTPSRGLVDQIFEQLATDIMSGVYAAGSHLPSERALAETLAVNRQVIREASRRLSQVGLVQVLHGDGTRVLDFRLHGGLDLLALLMEQGSAQKSSLRYWMPILELRSALAPDVVRHCTTRGSQALRDELLAVATRMSQARGAAELYKLEQRFWDLVHEGADHLVYRFTYNSFRRCSDSIREQSVRFTALEVKLSGYRLELARAMAAGKAARAEREVRSTMRKTLKALELELVKRRSRAAAKPAAKTRAKPRLVASARKRAAGP
jgi:GntR family transcriptional repressor for pyruvate dehydrogenase complex